MLYYRIETCDEQNAAVWHRCARNGNSKLLQKVETGDATHGITTSLLAIQGAGKPQTTRNSHDCFPPGNQHSFLIGWGSRGLPVLTPFHQWEQKTRRARTMRQRQVIEHPHWSDVKHNQPWSISMVGS